jgi:hypothetical protein
MTAKFALSAAGLTLFLASLPALAHHSFAAEFDSEKPVAMKGKFVKMDWVNPHSWIYMDVTGPDGKVVSWKCEALPPNGLYRGGWRKDSLKPGDEITVEGFLAKDGTSTMWTRTVTTAEGRRMFAGNADSLPPPRPAPTDQPKQ